MFRSFERQYSSFSIILLGSTYSRFIRGWVIFKSLATVEEGNCSTIAEVSKLTIQRIENAKYIVALDTLVSIAGAFDIPLKKLVDY